jgi:hypothetical protein
LGAVLAGLTALNLFRSREPGSADVDAPAASARVIERADDAAQRRGPDVGSSAPEARADAEGGVTASQPVSVVPSGSGPYASISAALDEHDVPPERRMPRPPDMLETERAFAAESVDPLWSTATEARVLSRIAEIPGVAYVSLNIECRTTLCLLQFVESATPAPNSGMVDVVNLVMPEGLNSLWTIGIRVRSGAAVSLAYLQRVETAEAPAPAPQ